MAAVVTVEFRSKYCSWVLISSNLSGCLKCKRFFMCKHTNDVQQFDCLQTATALLSHLRKGLTGMRTLAVSGFNTLAQVVDLSLTGGFRSLTTLLAQQCTYTGQQQGRKLQIVARLRGQVIRGFAAGPSRPAIKGPSSPTAAATLDKGRPSSLTWWWKSFQSAPTVPKVLGLAGAIPFIALAPPVTKHLVGVLPEEVVDNSAMIQACYGATIVSFLGAVHWGVAMGSSLAGPVAARIANEAFIYSVIPSLCAWPVALMEPGVGAMILSLLLPACFVADYSRRNMGLPQWYMALRVPLTLLATFGVLLTATRHVHSQLDQAKQVTQSESTSTTAAAVK